MSASCVSMNFLPVAADADLASTVPCAKCQASLNFHQPDVQRPHRLLGVCGDCETWYLVDLAAHVIVALPRIESNGRLADGSLPEG
jgi:hypothetical protein